MTSIRSILITRGAFADMYEPAWKLALDELGIKTEIFEAHRLTLPGVLGRIERRILFGPGIARIQNELVAKVKKERPDVTLLYQGHYFDKNTVDELRPYTFVTGYHNDDPFGPRKKMLRYRHLLSAMSRYHGFHVYRGCNVKEALSYGVPNVKVLMSYYLPWMDFPYELTSAEQKLWGCDVVFAGHVENDLRVECLSLLATKGISLRLYGEDHYWRKALPETVYEQIKPIIHVTGIDYRKALCGAKIAACFFSKWNRDQYTRRSFEIPACGVFMLAERTSVMMEMYKEGREAEYFSSPEEFIDKVNYYLANDIIRNKIAEAGYRRVIASGHDIFSRIRQWLSDIERWKSSGSGV